jgi:hypothetical protein
VKKLHVKKARRHRLCFQFSGLVLLLAKNMVAEVDEPNVEDAIGEVSLSVRTLDKKEWMMKVLNMAKKRAQHAPKYMITWY